MYRLPLDEGMWRTLPDAFGDSDIPQALRQLAITWDPEVADDLFWNCLCHQESCYPATYAAYPHVLDIAVNHTDLAARVDAALFLGFVALFAVETMPGDGMGLQGMPDPISGSEDRLQRIERIRRAFFEVQPAVVDVCLELIAVTEDRYARICLLAGAAAASGESTLGRLLDGGEDQTFDCPGCGSVYTMLRLEDRMAVYPDPRPPQGAVPVTELMASPWMHDHSEGMPNHCTMFVTPLPDPVALPPALKRLWTVAESGGPEDAFWCLRHFLGHFECPTCGRIALVSPSRRGQV